MEMRVIDQVTAMMYYVIGIVHFFLCTRSTSKLICNGKHRRVFVARFEASRLFIK